MEPLIIILVLSLLANVALGLMHLNKIKDQNKNFIPDSIEEKAKKVKEATMHRLSRVKEELIDIKNSIAEVGNQIGDLPDAVKGKTRTGRK